MMYANMVSVSDQKVNWINIWDSETDLWWKANILIGTLLEENGSFYVGWCYFIEFSKRILGLSKIQLKGFWNWMNSLIEIGFTVFKCALFERFVVQSHIKILLNNPGDWVVRLKCFPFCIEYEWGESERLPHSHISLHK